MHVDCVNKFEPLTSQKAEPSGSLRSGENIVDVNLVGNKVESLRREGKGEEVEGSYMEFFRVG